MHSRYYSYLKSPYTEPTTRPLHFTQRMASTVINAISALHLLCQQKRGSSFHESLSHLSSLALSSTGALGVSIIVATPDHHQTLVQVGTLPNLEILHAAWRTPDPFETILPADTTQDAFVHSFAIPLQKQLWLHIALVSFTSHLPTLAIELLELIKITCSQTLAREVQAQEGHHWKSLVEEHPAPILILDTEAVILYANQAGATVFGATSPLDLVGKSEYDFLAPEQKLLFDARIAALLAGQPTTPITYPIYLPDGTERIVQSFSIPITYCGKAAFQSVVRDITLRAQAEHALRESEERWRRLVEQHPNPLLISIDDTIVFVNPAGVDLLGAAEQNAILGRSTSSFLSARDWPVIAQSTIAGQSTELPPPEEYEIETLDGQTRCIEIYAGKISYGGKAAIQLVLRDMTDRHKSERHLKRYTERLRLLNSLQRRILTDAAFDAVADDTLIDLHQLIPYHRASVVEYHFPQHTATLRILRPRETAIASPPKPIPLHFTAYASSLLQGQQIYFPNIDVERLPSPSVQRMVYTEGIRSFVVTPLLIHNELLGALNVGVEHEEGFSENDQAILREIADLLAVCLKQGQLKAAQERYKQDLLAAKEKAEEMNRLKSTFLANMSHEIRTPLTSIIGFADVLAEEEVAEENREFASLIRVSGQRLLDTLNSVLDLAQLEGKTLTLYPEKLDLHEEVSSILKLFSRRAVDKGLFLRQEGIQTATFANLDRGAFTRILTNLLGNAIKFTDQGGIVVHLSTSEEHIMIEVQDTGIGISPKFLPDIFSEFRQESAGVSRFFEGSGLGLTITKRLVELMGGTIDVSSEKGKGSIFALRFKQVMPPEKVAFESPVLQSQPLSQPRRSLLIVEDNPDTVSLLKYFLGPNYSLVCASTVQEALTHTETTSFDAFLVDINLGEPETGVDLLHRLRAMPKHANKPVIACTAYALPSNRDQLLEAGFDAYISKPFTRATVLNTLGQMIA